MLTPALIKEFKKSPLKFIEFMWGLVHQPLICQENHDHKVKCFGEFIKGKHITWQQWLILMAVEKSLRGEASKRISVVSGRGVGKDTCLAWLAHWFLFTRKNAQIGATAPTGDQLFDVLWKEIAVWHRKLPIEIQPLFIWQSSYFRISESPETWFARARTAKKESPEAFAGLHGEHVALFGDEASGIPDEIFRIGEASLTNKDTLVVLIGNPMRLTGFFYDTHHKDKQNWQTLEFSSLDSPIVDPEMPARVIAKYGEDSDEYRVDVLGQFPKGEGMQDGWLPMFSEDDIKEIPDVGSFMKPVYMGVDPSGLGKNKSVWVIRDAFKAKIGAREPKSSSLTIAEKTITLGMHYEIKPENMKVDNFGCFDDKTEILTDEGFKLFSGLNGKEKILSLNLENDEASWQKIKKVYRYDFDGKLNYYSGRSLNFGITDNHKLVVKTWDNKWETKEYQKLRNSHFALRTLNKWSGKNEEYFSIQHERNMPNGGQVKKGWKWSMSDWAEFLGWFVSEGCVYMRKEGKGKWEIYHINIAQKNLLKRNLIRNLLEKMFLGFKENEKGFTIQNQNLGKHLLEHCGKYARNKRIPKYIKESNRQIIRAFLNSFGLGDGWKLNYGGTMYSTSSKLLADDIQECLIKLGLAGKMKVAQKKGSEFFIDGRKVIRKNDTYQIYENKTPCNHEIKKSEVIKKQYKGYVYCVETNPYHTILVRRGGAIMWSGNSGANVAQEIALADHSRVHAINVGGKPKDERFLNIRAEMYWLLREWLKKGGKLVKGGDWRQLLTIRYNRTLQGKIRVMGKEEMVKKGWDSPDDADALAMTFVPEGVGAQGIIPGISSEELSDSEIAELTKVY